MPYVQFSNPIAISTCYNLFFNICLLSFNSKGLMDGFDGLGGQKNHYK
jgi:hypothetical protein